MDRQVLNLVMKSFEEQKIPAQVTFDGRSYFVDFTKVAHAIVVQDEMVTAHSMHVDRDRMRLF